MKLVFTILFLDPDHLHNTTVKQRQCNLLSIKHNSCLHVSVSVDIMVWEVVAPTVLSIKAKHQESESQREHTGKYRVNLHVCCVITANTMKT